MRNALVCIAFMATLFTGISAGYFLGRLDEGKSRERALVMPPCIDSEKATPVEPVQWEPLVETERIKLAAVLREGKAMFVAYIQDGKMRREGFIDAKVIYDANAPWMERVTSYKRGQVFGHRLYDSEVITLHLIRGSQCE